MTKNGYVRTNEVAAAARLDSFHGSASWDFTAVPRGIALVTEHPGLESGVLRGYED